ncbi:PREDICTED: probable UDP-N-acetylglucosamine--peptide N-acetylglucosaminyltransferase SPINDLY isoform X2 [Nicotiana attenuata]|uniref:probable UDP-N-acetylglucosamine--peptide N-acetylglucosaminyltransferase SPINDLY isoform X2 n=1 Tax=Nicotiana attenuata TaxID=49451 RepID=UPI0009056CD6|nr:PREDICTED: probable UDP-N-acetylglucosamine--peptide N-acetylglucosaminyltransferase SPINDLY isoform X2 [Nicotiana attenuata]
MKSESPVVDRTSITLRLQPPPPQSHPSKIILADLNVDPPDSDGNDSVPVTAVSPTSFSRVKADEICQDKLKKDIEVADTEGKQLKKLGKCRSRMGKLDCPPDCNGADAEPDHNVQGVPSSREEKVSSLKTGLIHVARKMPKNAHAHFVLGLMYQRMGQPQKAILAYEKAEEILVRPEEEIDRPELLSLVQVHHAQCILLGTLEDCSSDEELDPEEIENILAKLKEAVKSDVTQVSIWNTLGVILLRIGRLQSAISVFSTLLDISPDNLDCLGNLGIACLRSGNLELSEKCFQDLLLKDQNHPTALINYAALLLYKFGSVVAGAGANALDGTSADQVIAANVAKECLLAALKADSKAAHTWTNLANAYHLMGDHRSAAKCLEKAGKLEPNCLATRYAVGVHRIRDAERSQNPNEQLSWAGNEMASILREGDSTSIESPIAWAGLAMVHRAQHEIVAGFEIEHNELMEVKEHAIYSLKQAIAEDPADAVQWHQLGLHSLCSQQFRTSQMYLKAAVARRKDCPYAWSNLGISLQLSEESSPAEEVYKQALSLATSKQAHTIFSNLGNLYRQIKQYERAKAMFTKSLQLQPGYAPALNNLGLVCVAEGKWEEAKNCFNKAIQADPLLDAAKSNMIKASSMFKMHTSMS